MAQIARSKSHQIPSIDQIQSINSDNWNNNFDWFTINYWQNVRESMNPLMKPWRFEADKAKNHDHHFFLQRGNFKSFRNSLNKPEVRWWRKDVQKHLLVLRFEELNLLSTSLSIAVYFQVDVKSLSISLGVETRVDVFLIGRKPTNNSCYLYYLITFPRVFSTRKKENLCSFVCLCGFTVPSPG